MNSFPSLSNLMPFGGGAEFVEGERTSTFSQPTIFSNLSSNYIENGLKLLFAILGVIQVMLPVTWVYFKIRAKLDQSLVETMLILPVVVAGVVIIVQNSWALAFALAGIVASVRFRNTLKNTGDSFSYSLPLGLVSPLACECWKSLSLSPSSSTTSFLFFGTLVTAPTTPLSSCARQTRKREPRRPSQWNLCRRKRMNAKLEKNLPPESSREQNNPGIQPRIGP